MESKFILSGKLRKNGHYKVVGPFNQEKTANMVGRLYFYEDHLVEEIFTFDAMFEELTNE